MRNPIKIFEGKMIRAGLTGQGDAVFAIRNQDYNQSKKDNISAVLEKTISTLNRDVAVFARPAEPYRALIDYLASDSGSAIYPRDFETGILLTDLPVVDGLDERKLTAALKTRRGVIVKGEGMVATAKSDIERAFVILSSMAFACFVKFFVDHLYHTRQGTIDGKRLKVFDHVVNSLEQLPPLPQNLAGGPFRKEEEVLSAMENAGAVTVESRLVDSNFGNISYRLDNDLYISRTGSALDELSGKIDRVALGETTVPATVSTEFPAHREIAKTTGKRAVLHGHPKFSVILSMDCERTDCESKDSCRTKCPYPRSIGGIPVVSGEAGGGKLGLANTVPPAMRRSNAVIVYGHGIFAAGENDFNETFRTLWETEDYCRREYFRRIS
jgi:ribulose-5-phosphate 4-epimerase/fuculose-1-phosphate aldolase